MFFSISTVCASSSSSGQLILPEALKLSPLYTLGLMNSPGLVGSDAKPDERSAWLARALTAGADRAAPMAYPCLSALQPVGPGPEASGAGPNGL